MPKPIYYEGQIFDPPEGSADPALVYRGGKFFPLNQDPGLAKPKVAAPSPTDAKALQDYRDQAARALDVATQAERFVDINRKHGTGGFLSLPFVSDMAATTMAPYGEMESITSKVAPSLRPPGSGSSSDKDVKFYRRGFPNLDFPGQTNANIAKDRQNDSDAAAARSAFMDKWFETRGTLVGAEKAFGQFWNERQRGKLPTLSNGQTKRATTGAAGSSGFKYLGTE